MGPPPDQPSSLSYRASDPDFQIRRLKDQIQTQAEDLRFANEAARIRDEQLLRLRALHSQDVEQYEARIAELEALVAELRKNQRPQGSRRGN